MMLKRSLAKFSYIYDAHGELLAVPLLCIVNQYRLKKEFLSNKHNAIENNPIKYKYVLPSTTTISIMNLISCDLYRYWFRVYNKNE